MGKTKTGGTIKETMETREKNHQRSNEQRERSSVEDDQREHETMDDEGRKKQVQVTRRSLRHKVTSVDANTLKSIRESRSTFVDFNSR